MKWVLEYVEPAKDRAEAAQMAEWIKGQDGCLSSRVIGDGASKPFAMQAFFADEPNAQWLPDGMNRRLCPEALLS